jgi:hypothetical protein
MQKTEDKNIQKKNPDKKKSQKVDQKTADKSQKNTNTNKKSQPQGNGEKSTAKKKPAQKSTKKVTANKLEEEMPLPEPKPIEAVQKIPENKISEKKKEEEEQDKMPEIPLEEANKYEFNLYKHLKENIKNKDKLCKDGISSESLYCLECKVSVCPKCALFKVHNGHELVQKFPYYKCDKSFVDESFKDIDSIFSLNPSYLNINKVKGELKMQISNQISQLINQLNKVKDTKMEEVENIFVGTENCVEKLRENELKVKKNLNNFLETQKNFFCIDINEGVDSQNVNPEASEVLKNLEGEGASPMGMIQPNKDTVNSTFLLTYDLLKNTEFMNNLIRDIFIDIKSNTERYINEFTSKAKEVEEAINKLLTPFEGMFKYQYLLCDFYAQINHKISKYNKKIEDMKNIIFEKVNKRGGFDDIERDNRIANTQIATRFENILNNQLIDEDEATTIRSLMTKGKKNRKYGAGASKAASIMTSSKMKGGTLMPGAGKDNLLTNLPKIYESPDEIKLNKDILQEYFIYEALNFVKNNFRKKKNVLDELNEEFDGEVDIAKPIPGTNEMQCYDKKTKNIIKKVVKFDKKVHKYTYFLNGCRTLLIKDRLYIIGGVDKENQITKVAYVYYIRTNELKAMPDMLRPHAYHSVDFLDYYKSIVVVGGENISSCELYDMNIGGWRDLPEMKIPRAHCGIYLDKMNHAIYSFFGVIGNITDKNNYTDVLECLELRKLALGWYKIDYNNKAEMNFKSGINKILPLTPEMVLIYGATNMRDFAKKSAVYLIPKQEIIKIDNKIFNEIREASKKSKKLSKVLTSYI